MAAEWWTESSTLAGFDHGDTPPVFDVVQNFVRPGRSRLIGPYSTKITVRCKVKSQKTEPIRRSTLLSLLPKMKNFRNSSANAGKHLGRVPSPGWISRGNWHGGDIARMQFTSTGRKEIQNVVYLGLLPYLNTMSSSMGSTLKVRPNGLRQLIASPRTQIKGAVNVCHGCRRISQHVIQESLHNCIALLRSSDGPGTDRVI